MPSSAIIQSFLSKHYSICINLNLGCGNGCKKKYTPRVPELVLKKQNKLLIYFSMCRVTDDITVKNLGNVTVNVESFEEGTRIRRKYKTFFGNNEHFCSCLCMCYNFRRYRMHSMQTLLQDFDQRRLNLMI